MEWRTKRRRDFCGAYRQGQIPESGSCRLRARHMGRFRICASTPSHVREPMSPSDVTSVPPTLTWLASQELLQGRRLASYSPSAARPERNSKRSGTWRPRSLRADSWTWTKEQGSGMRKWKLEADQSRGPDHRGASYAPQGVHWSGAGSKSDVQLRDTLTRAASGICLVGPASGVRQRGYMSLCLLGVNPTWNCVDRHTPVRRVA